MDWLGVEAGEVIGWKWVGSYMTMGVVVVTSGD